MTWEMFKNGLLALIVLIAVAPQAQGQDITNTGGDLSNDIQDRNAIQAPAPNVTDDDRKAKQVSGFIDFHTRFGKAEGRGPRFVNVGCGSCHINNAKGPVGLSRRGDRRDAMVVKVSKKGIGEDGAPINVGALRGSDQLQTRNSRNRRQHRARLRWRTRTVTLPDDTVIKLRKPRTLFRVRRRSQRAFRHSTRMTPPVIGPGLLESIPEATILGFSDPEDSNDDGISGVPQYVPNIETAMFDLGRFGFRASNPTLKQQSAAAAFFDMGITSTMFPGKNSGDPELADSDLEELTVYQALAGVPRARNQADASVIQGKSLFMSIGCVDCHKINITTENSEFPELDGQTIHPFTDLLLHDMGPGLQDKRAEFSASGSEWRTSPLWGIGFIERLLPSGKIRYLHDGRARNLTEAILWHAGEADTARTNFENLSAADRDALVVFLRSL